MKPFGLIFDNLGLKLLALLMAWAVWYMARANLVEPANLNVKVKVVVAEGDAAIRARPLQEHVSVTVEGPAREVGDLRVTPDLTAVVTLPPQADEPGSSRDFGVQDVVFRGIERRDGVRIVRMEPDVIKVKWDRIGTARVSVQRPDVKKEIGGVTVEIQDYDTAATIRGTLTDLSRVPVLRTFVDENDLADLDSELDPLRPTGFKKVELRIDPDQARLVELIEPKSLSMRLAVRAITPKAVWLPVRILYERSEAGDVPRRLRFSLVGVQDVYQPATGSEPPKVSLQLEGAPGIMSDLDPSRLMAFVLESDLGPEQQTAAILEVHVEGLPFGVRVSRPVRVSVEVVQ